MEFPIATASFSSRKESVASTGPKISSRAIRMSGVTPSKTVASKNAPFPSTAARLPPATTFAPSLFPLSTYRSTLSRCFSETSEPSRVLGSIGSAGIIFFARSTSARTSASWIDSSTRSRDPAEQSSPLP